MEDGRWKFFVLFHLSEVYPELVNEIPLFSFPLPERSRRQRKRKKFHSSRAARNLRLKNIDLFNLEFKI